MLNRIRIKIRDDKSKQFQNFKFGFDLKIQNDKPTLARGIIEIKDKNQIQEMKKEVTDSEGVSKVTKGRNDTNLIQVVTFDSRNLPMNIVGHQISPALRSVFWCNKCPGFGHTKHVYYKELQCPHCAEHHPHVKCKSKSNKCANCSGEHQRCLQRISSLL